MASYSLLPLVKEKGICKIIEKYNTDYKIYSVEIGYEWEEHYVNHYKTLDKDKLIDYIIEENYDIVCYKGDYDKIDIKNDLIKYEGWNGYGSSISIDELIIKDINII